MAAPEAVSAAIADAISTLLLYPLDVIKLRCQAGDGVTAMQVLFDGIKNKDLYSGLGGKLCMSMQQKVQFFYMYASLKKFYSSKTRSTATSLLLGYIAAVYVFDSYEKITCFDAQTHNSITPSPLSLSHSQFHYTLTTRTATLTIPLPHHRSHCHTHNPITPSPPSSTARVCSRQCRWKRYK